MKTAAICLAYLGNPAGIDCLAEYLAGTETNLFVHVDAKVDDAPYRDTVAKWPHVSLLADRLPIYWGGFNTVRAIVRAIEAVSIAQTYHRYLFLTEDTVPLVSRAEYYACMASNVEFIDCRKTVNPKMLERYNEFYYFDSGATSARPLTTHEREVTPEVLVAMHRLQALRARGKAIVPAICHGSGWFGLTSSRIETILHSYHEDSHLRESFEFSAIPEEQYFHTIIGDMRDTRKFIFADYTRPPHPYVFRSAEDIEATETAGALFIRKVALGSASIRQFVQRLI